MLLIVGIEPDPAKPEYGCVTHPGSARPLLASKNLS
jgi:hypothetical protein